MSAEAPKFGDVENPKVGSIPVEIAPGKEVYVCTCGQSQKFPLCDGTHRKLNLPQKPQKVANETEAEKTIWVCACGQSKNRPFCDGSHSHLSEDELKSIETAQKAYQKKKLIKKAARYATYAVLAAGAALTLFKGFKKFRS